MYSEEAKRKIKYVTKWANKIKSDIYNCADIYDKLLSVETFDSYIAIGLSDVEVRYHLKENENLTFTANQLLENIDEALNFKDIHVAGAEYLTEMSLFRFECFTHTNTRVEIMIDFSGSTNCNLEYKEVMTKKAILKCD